MAFRSLKDELGTDGAQALLMQTMFAAYLEDREIIGEAVFRDASQGRFVKLLELLEAGDTATFETLRSEEHTSELQSLMRISYAVFCLKKKNNYNTPST